MRDRFLLAESEEALLIGMENQMDDTRPGRWRLKHSQIEHHRTARHGRGEGFPGPLAKKSIRKQNILRNFLMKPTFRGPGRLLILAFSSQSTSSQSTVI